MSTAPTLRLVSPSDAPVEAPLRAPSRCGARWSGRGCATLRRRRGLTLAEVARRAGISPQYLSEVERGRKDPSSEVLAAISGALGCEVVEVTQLASLDLRRQHAAVELPPPGEIRLSA